MSASSTIRLVHASDLHLERPVSGFDLIPDHLRDELLDAPFAAARQVFETTLTEAADALLLAGDVIDCELAGPRGMAFLLQQFKRLKERGITVYWAGGDVDPVDSWPASIPLPDNVVRFAAGRVSDYELRRDNATVARIQGVSCRSQDAVPSTGFHRDAHGLPTVGIAFGDQDDRATEGRNVHYMALGGRHAHQTVDDSPAVVHYCGTPQGRTPAEIGPHSCTLVVIDASQPSPSIQMRPIVTDAIRFIDESIEITATTEPEQLEERLTQRMDKIAGEASSAQRLVSLSVLGNGALVNQLRPGAPLTEQVLRSLRERFGHASPATWALSLSSPSRLSVPAEWYDEETILGDLLRQFRGLEDSEAADLDLGQFLPAGQASGALARLGKVAARRREHVVDRAAKLGLELLEVTAERPD